MLSCLKIIKMRVIFFRGFIIFTRSLFAVFFRRLRIGKLIGNDFLDFSIIISCIVYSVYCDRI